MRSVGEFMRLGKFKIALLGLCCVVIAFEVWHLRSGSGVRPTASAEHRHKPDFVLLPESEVATFAQTFADPKPRVESWEPTVGDIDDLKSNLAQISALSSKEPDTNRHIDHPDQYFRQYLAVVVNGKKIIFVNAMCSVDAGQHWRKRLALANDGGRCFWHAIYDPATQTFSELNINGLG